MSTLIIDTGQNIVGIANATNGKYVAYRDANIARALQRISSATEVVTYNGVYRDIPDLEEFSRKLGLGSFKLSKTHSDMRQICWSDRIWGSDLKSNYDKHFSSCPSFKGDSHTVSNRLDVYMTLQLRRLWKGDRLKVLDGCYR